MMKPPVPFFDPKDLLPYRERVSILRRFVCLAPADWQALGDTLQQLYPAGLYLRGLAWEERWDNP